MYCALELMRTSPITPTAHLQHRGAADAHALYSLRPHSPHPRTVRVLTLATSSSPPPLRVISRPNPTARALDDLPPPHRAHTPRAFWLRLLASLRRLRAHVRVCTVCTAGWHWAAEREEEEAMNRGAHKSGEGRGSEIGTACTSASQHHHRLHTQLVCRPPPRSRVRQPRRCPTPACASRPSVTLGLPALTRAVLVLRARPARCRRARSVQSGWAVDPSLLALQPPAQSRINAPRLLAHSSASPAREQPTHRGIHSPPFVELSFVRGVGGVVTSDGGATLRACNAVTRGSPFSHLAACLHSFASGDQHGRPWDAGVPSCCCARWFSGRSRL
ncbi:hypothetical protein C8J57DRAFT_1719535 [Mycena rebaudengoi]|nr:hypothetical protein C8J57DRAFT_1719535 [Mycena rebaudengoi]